MSFAVRRMMLSELIDLGNLASTVLTSVLSPATATAQVSLGTDGSASYQDSAGTTNFNWRAPSQSGVGANYWARLTVNTGSTPTGAATGSWLQLNTARTWTLSRSGIGTTTANLTLQIARDAAGTDIAATRTFTLTADVTP